MASVTEITALTTETLADLSISSTALNGALGTATSEYSAYLTPCVGYDSLILDKIDEINLKKSQIVTLLTNHYDKLVANCAAAPKNPGVPGVSNGSFVSASGIKGDACLLQTNPISVASTAIVSGTLTTFGYNCQVFIDGSGGVGIGTTEQCDIGVRGEVRKETLYSLVYPYLENMTISVNDWTGIGPLDGNILAVGGEVGFNTHIGIGTTSVGIGTTRNDLGIGQSVFQFTDVYDPKSVHKNQSKLIGYYYPINDPGCGTTITSAVQTLENEIITIRSGIGTLIPVANSARKIKVDVQIDKWWITKVGSENSTSSSDIQTYNDNLTSVPYPS
jgi:hypothetical protein